MIADFKAASFTDQVLVIGVIVVAVFMIIMMLQLCNIAAIGRRLNQKMKKVVSLEKKASKKGRRMFKPQETATPSIVRAVGTEGYVKAVKKEQPIIVNVNAPVSGDQNQVGGAGNSANYSAWTGYDNDEEDDVAYQAPVMVAPIFNTEDEEEPVEEVIEPTVETVEEPVEEVVEPATETVEEPVEEIVEPATETVEEPVEEVIEPATETVEEPVEDKAGKFAVIDTSVIIPKKTHEEKYSELDEESKKYYDAIMTYAEGLADVKRQSSVNADTIFYGRTCVVKTQIKQTRVVCSFSMLDVEMKRMLKGNKGAQEKFTSIRVVDDESLEAAKKSVDFAYKAAIAEKEYKHQMQLQKRRDARKAKKEAAATEAE